MCSLVRPLQSSDRSNTRWIILLNTENTTELVTDLVRKAKQIEYLIQSLPEPEAEETQVGARPFGNLRHTDTRTQARRLQALESEMTQANEEYAKAVKRASERLLRSDPEMYD